MSLVEALRGHAARSPGSAAFTFLERGEREAGSLDYGRLDLRARAIAAHLQAQGAAGQPVALALPTGLGFVEAFFGCLYAGAIAVPMPDAQTRRGAERAQAILRDSAARPLPAPETIADAAAAGWREAAPAPGSLALLQYTSGSTAAPRGVMIPHGALAANIEAIARAFALDASTRGVNWLPLYHDMGLIAGVAAPASLGIPSVLLPPLAFLQNPLRWLRAISHYRGTTSGAPSFAYELCARALERRGSAGLDLSSWKVAFCGGEPVRAEALERFARAAAPAGFARGALLPCYGLAEATLLVSAAEPGAGVAQAGGRVDCGAACAGTQVEIGAGGEILVRGPGVTPGYWQRAEASRELFRDGWLRTGDLGALHQGRLVVSGRLKDLVVIRGENHHPEDIEMSVRRAHAALGDGAAFSVDGEAGEELVLVHEVAGAAAPVQAIAEEVAEKVAAQVAEDHGLALRELVLIRPMTLPRTANGKVQRGRCRAAYLEGGLAVLARVSP